MYVRWGASLQGSRLGTTTLSSPVCKIPEVPSSLSLSPSDGERVAFRPGEGNYVGRISLVVVPSCARHSVRAERRTDSTLRRARRRALPPTFSRR